MVKYLAAVSEGDKTVVVPYEVRGGQYHVEVFGEEKACTVSPRIKPQRWDSVEGLGKKANTEVVMRNFQVVEAGLVELPNGNLTEDFGAFCVEMVQRSIRWTEEGDSYFIDKELVTRETVRAGFELNVVLSFLEAMMAAQGIGETASFAQEQAKRLLMPPLPDVFNYIIVGLTVGLFMFTLGTQPLVSEAYTNGTLQFWIGPIVFVIIGVLLVVKERLSK